jgi:hypothetical protein
MEYEEFRELLKKAVQAAYIAYHKYNVFSPSVQDIEDLACSIVLKLTEQGEYYPEHGLSHLVYIALTVLRDMKSPLCNNSELDESLAYSVVTPQKTSELDLEQVYQIVAAYRRQNRGNRANNKFRPATERALRLEAGLIKYLAEGVPLPRIAELLGITYIYAKELKSNLRLRLEKGAIYEMQDS